MREKRKMDFLSLKKHGTGLNCGGWEYFIFLCCELWGFNSSSLYP